MAHLTHEGEAAMYYADYDDRIEPREATGLVIPEGRFGCSQPTGCLEVRSENISSANYRGVEAGFSVDVSESVEVYGTLNYTYGEKEKHDESGPANRVPPLNGQVGLLIDVGPRALIEAYVLWATRQNRLDEDDLSDVRIDPSGTDAWATVNVLAAYTLDPRWRVQLELTNLLDATYREHGSGVDGPGFGATLTVQAGF